VAERDLPNEIPELRYVEVEDQARLASMRFESSNWWGVQIPIALCVRCATRRTRTRTLMESPYTITRRMILRSCAATVIAQRLARSFIETVFTDPKKILQVQDLDNRVRELEKQNGRFWTAVQLAYGLLAVLITAVLAIAVALAY
jgi:hypothetical protein